MTMIPCSVYYQQSVAVSDWGLFPFHFPNVQEAHIRSRIYDDYACITHQGKRMLKDRHEWKRIAWQLIRHHYHHVAILGFR